MVVVASVGVYLAQNKADFMYYGGDRLGWFPAPKITVKFEWREIKRETKEDWEEWSGWYFCSSATILKDEDGYCWRSGTEEGCCRTLASAKKQAREAAERNWWPKGL